MAFRAGAILLLAVAAAMLPLYGPTSLPLRPEPVIVVVAVVALLQGPLAGGLAGLAAGWVVDLLPPLGEPLGASALLLLVAGAAAGWCGRLRTWSWLVPFVVTAGAAAFVLVVRSLVAVATGGPVSGAAVLASWGATIALSLVLIPALLAAERTIVERGWP